MRPSIFPLATVVLLFVACGKPASEPASSAPAETTSTDASEPIVRDAPKPGAPVVDATPDLSNQEKVLTVQGVGGLSIGMTREDLAAAYGGPSGANEGNGCEYYHPDAAPKGVFVMVEDDLVSRITLSRDAEIISEAGVALGDTADEAKAKLGADASVSPHKYEAAPAEYLTVWTNGAGGEAYVTDTTARGMRYEIGSDGTVQSISAGGPSIQYVEGCS